MITLILDTTLADCTAVLADGASVLAAKSETLNRGHAERLPSMVEEVLAEAGKSYSDLEKVVAVNGPGTFAGVRVAISLAHGIATATGCARGGIGLHEVLERQLMEDRCAIYIMARGGLAMRQLFEDCQAVGEPETRKLEEWQQAPEWDWPAGIAWLPGGEPDADAKALKATPELLAAVAVEAGDLKALYMRPPDAAKAKQVFKVAGQ